MPRIGYNDWRDRAPSARTRANLTLVGDVRRLQMRHQGRYGSPRMQAKARHAVFGYSEGYDNRHRVHSALGYLTPEQAEHSMTG